MTSTVDNRRRALSSRPDPDAGGGEQAELRQLAEYLQRSNLKAGKAKPVEMTPGELLALLDRIQSAERDRDEARDHHHTCEAEAWKTVQKLEAAESRLALADRLAKAGEPIAEGLRLEETRSRLGTDWIVLGRARGSHVTVGHLRALANAYEEFTS